MHILCYHSAYLDTCALQSSPRNTPRNNIAQLRYLDEGHPYTNVYHLDDPHPYTYNPTKRSDMGLSNAMRRNRVLDDGVDRGFYQYYDDEYNTESIDSSSSSYQYGVDGNSSTEDQILDDQVDEDEYEYNEIPQHQSQKRSIWRRKGKLAPRQLGTSMMSKGNRRRKEELLTFEEEKEIAEDIRCFRSVTRTRDEMIDWMTKEIQRKGGSHTYHRGEPSDYQLAAACYITVDQLHDIMSKGQEARTRLIQGNVGLVTQIAKRYYNMLSHGAGGTDATLKLDDLIQEGYLGIMEAAERYDPTKGFRFSTYATHWIRQKILRSIAESSRMIRLPVHIQTMVRNMHKKNKELEEMNGRRPSIPELAHEMNIPLDKVHLYQHLSKNVLSLEQSVDRHSYTDDKRTIGDKIACTDEDFLSDALREEIQDLLESLGHDEQQVLTHRFGLHDGVPKSIREVSEGMGVSSDIVRNVQAKALNRLRKPQVNHRLKDYIGGLEQQQQPDYHVEPQYHEGWAYGNGEEQLQHHQQQNDENHYYHYPHHMNAHAARLNMSDNDDGRPSPEAMWGV